MPPTARCWSIWREIRLTRSDLIFALGGGVTGDLAGFAAATYQRGIDFFQLPTTFLAAVDASVGGKTAVDLGGGKESGRGLSPASGRPLRHRDLRHPPAGDLSGRAGGDGEARPYRRPGLFDYLMTADLRADIDAVVRRNVEIKAAVVAEDERERGMRKLLNFGHTLGHGIETYSGYTVSHGHAVAIGMALAARGAERMGLSPAGTLDAVLDAARRLGLPTECPCGAEDLYEAATADKKRSGDAIDVVVLREIGRAETVRLTLPELREFVEAAL